MSFRPFYHALFPSDLPLPLPSYSIHRLPPSLSHPYSPASPLNETNILAMGADAYRSTAATAGAGEVPAFVQVPVRPAHAAAAVVSLCRAQEPPEQRERDWIPAHCSAPVSLVFFLLCSLVPSPTLHLFFSAFFAHTPLCQLFL